MERLGISLVLMVLLAAAVAGHYYWRLSDMTQELAELRVVVNQAKTNLVTKQSYAEARRRSFEAAKGIVAEYNALTEEQNELARQVSAMEAQNLDIQKRFVEAVMKVRKAAADLPPQEIELKSGQVLAAAKVQRMSDSDVTFQHAGGISRVDVGDLPPEFRDRFRQQMSPFTIEGGLTDPLAPAPKGKKK